MKRLDLWPAPVLHALPGGRGSLAPLRVWAARDLGRSSCVSSWERTPRACCGSQPQQDLERVSRGGAARVRVGRNHSGEGPGRPKGLRIAGQALTIPQKELRNNVADVLRRAEAGEEFLITVAGRPVAQLGPAQRRRWVSGPDMDRLWDSATPQTLAGDLERIPGELADPFA